jgi:hypothetical protein
MNPAFAAAVETLHSSFQRLLGMRPIKNAELPPNMPSSGVYGTR